MEFYPGSAPVPAEKRTSRLFLRPLRTTDVELDYDAVISSAELLRRWSHSNWPAHDFTLSKNLMGVGLEIRLSFNLAYGRLRSAFQ